MTQANDHSILLVDISRHFGSDDVRVLDTARALHGNYNYTVATLVDSPIQQRLEREGLNYLAVPYGRRDVRLGWFLRRAIGGGRFTVVDAHNLHSLFWGQLATLGKSHIKRVSTVHSLYRDEYRNPLKGRIFEQALLINKRMGVEFVAASETVFAYLQDIGIPREQVTLIHNGIPLPKPTPHGKNIPLFRELGWGDANTIVIVVARLENIKGQQYLIEALSQLMGGFPDLRCLLVGDGYARETLEAQVAQANVQEFVHFAGFRDDVSELLSASDIFCLPSLTEGLPYALLEACAHKLPMLVSNVGGMGELLTHRQNAYMVAAQDPHALANGLRWLITHPRQSKDMGMAAFHWSQRNFNLETMLNSTLDVYFR